MRKFMIAFCFIFICIYHVASSWAECSPQYNYVYIDPGHGGADGGALRADVKEADLNLKISMLLKSEFENNGYKVLLTRDGDYDLATDSNNRKRTDIRKRVELINNSNADLYVSVHMNMFSQSIYRGAQVFYNNKNQKSKILGEYVQDSISKYLNNTSRKSKPISGVYLVENVKKVGCLVECGFLSNNEEFDLLQDDAYQTMMAKAIFYGCQQYLIMT